MTPAVNDVLQWDDWRVWDDVQCVGRDADALCASANHVVRCLGRRANNHEVSMLVSVEAHDSCTQASHEELVLPADQLDGVELRRLNARLGECGGRELKQLG